MRPSSAAGATSVVVEAAAANAGAESLSRAGASTPRDHSRPAAPLRDRRATHLPVAVPGPAGRLGRGSASDVLLALPAEAVVVLLPLRLIRLGAPALDTGQFRRWRSGRSGAGRQRQRQRAANQTHATAPTPRASRGRRRALPAEIIVPRVVVARRTQAASRSRRAQPSRPAPRRPAGTATDAARPPCGACRRRATTCGAAALQARNHHQGDTDEGDQQNYDFHFVSLHTASCTGIEVLLDRFLGLYCGHVPAREEEHSANFVPAVTAAGPESMPPGAPRPAPVIVAFGLKPERLVGAEGRIDAVPEPPTAEQAGLLVDALASGIKAGGSVIAIVPDWFAPEGLQRLEMARTMLDTARVAIHVRRSRRWRPRRSPRWPPASARGSRRPACWPARCPGSPSSCT